MEAPAWLPYRIRNRWNHAAVERAIRGLHTTRPIPVSPAQASLVEIHMLLCRRDVQIGVLALKSLLRFGQVAWAVTITDDGSVTPEQRQWIDQHVPGCRWLPRIVATDGVEKALADRPRLAALYRSDYHPLRKLIHPISAGLCPKVLVLDPDAAFFRRPDRLHAWATSGSTPALFLHDHQPEDVNVPHETRAAFDELKERVAPAGKPWAMPYYFFNSGLLAYRPVDCDLDVAERYLEWLDGAAMRYTTGKPGLWFGAWTPEQTAYQLIFARMDPPAIPLGEEYRVGNRPGYTFNHFLWLQLIQTSSHAMLQSVIAELERV